MADVDDGATSFITSVVYHLASNSAIFCTLWPNKEFGMRIPGTFQAMKRIPHGALFHAPSRRQGAIKVQGRDSLPLMGRPQRFEARAPHTIKGSARLQSSRSLDYRPEGLRGAGAAQRGVPHPLPILSPRLTNRVQLGVHDHDVGPHLF